ncbi:AAA family ATPase [Nocardia salmonicida]|uniref:AAA family ATPase n=1 Tax=Nocardia salmonicida TaxID=53431 RepID=UPI00343F1951
MSTAAQARYKSVRPGRPTEWTVRDFKAIEHASLPCLPLSLLLGPNSSGKSSLIQSLLLLVQSTEDEIVLNGPLVRLGVAEDVIRIGSQSTVFSFVVNCTNDISDNAVPVLFEITMESDAGTLVVADFVAVDQSTEMTLIRATSHSRVPSEVRDNILQESRRRETILRVTEIFDKSAPPFTFATFAGLTPTSVWFRRTRAQVQADLGRQLVINKDPIESEASLEIVFRMLEWISRRNASQTTKESEKARYDALHSILHSSRKMQKDLLHEFVGETLPEDIDTRIFVNRIPAGRSIKDYFPPPNTQHEAAIILLGLAADVIGLMQRSTSYLGPLREEPQVVYPTGGRYKSLPVGAKGEFTADVIARSKRTVVHFQTPAGIDKRSSLQEALTEWAEYLGIGESVSVSDLGKLGRGLQIMVNGVERDLTMVGVGASQLIPVLTIVLTARSGATVLLEQPELHLHPSVQSKLADFFVYARPDIRLVVETHSEYLLTRIRRRVVENFDVASGIAVLFSEQEQGVSGVRRLHLDKLGDFSSWPVGFFDTQEGESAELAKAVHKAVLADK